MAHQSEHIKGESARGARRSAEGRGGARRGAAKKVKKVKVKKVKVKKVQVKKVKKVNRRVFRVLLSLKFETLLLSAILAASARARRTLRPSWLTRPGRGPNILHK